VQAIGCCCAPDVDVGVLQREERIHREVDIARTSMYVTARCSVLTAYRIQEEERACELFKHESATVEDVAAVLQGEGSAAYAAFETTTARGADTIVSAESEPEETTAVVSNRAIRSRLAMRQMKVDGKVVPDVVANVLAAVVVKVGGTMAHTDANRLVVSKVCRQVMKVANMRDVDVMMYEPHVIETYFSCRNYQATAGMYRRKVAPWLLKLLGFKDPRPLRA